jgi:hypothetical protein
MILHVLVGIQTEQNPPKDNETRLDILLSDPATGVETQYLTVILRSKSTEFVRAQLNKIIVNDCKQDGSGLWRVPIREPIAL